MLVDTDRLINFRDLGGLAVRGGGRTRDGVLLRSDSLVYASESDAHHLRHIVGLRTIVDLRDVELATADGRGRLGIDPDGVEPIDYLPLPCADVGVTPDTRHLYYHRLLGGNGTDFAGLFRRLAGGGAVPVLVHCHLGCDRTGTVVAMLLRLAGVSDEEICADYARSVGAAPGIRARAEARRAEQGLAPLNDAFYGAWANKPDIMAQALALVDEQWGSMHGWAAAHGITGAEIAAWRSILVG